MIWKKLGGGGGQGPLDPQWNSSLFVVHPLALCEDLPFCWRESFSIKSKDARFAVSEKKNPFFLKIFLERWPVFCSKVRVGCSLSVSGRLTRVIRYLLLSVDPWSWSRRPIGLFCNWCNWYTFRFDLSFFSRHLLDRHQQDFVLIFQKILTFSCPVGFWKSQNLQETRQLRLSSYVSTKMARKDLKKGKRKRNPG